MALQRSEMLPVEASRTPLKCAALAPGRRIVQTVQYTFFGMVLRPGWFVTSMGEGGGGGGGVGPSK